jgi:hypothetical protein
VGKTLHWHTPLTEPLGEGLLKDALMMFAILRKNIENGRLVVKGISDGLDPARVARITKLPKKQIMAFR